MWERKHTNGRSVGTTAHKFQVSGNDRTEISGQRERLHTNVRSVGTTAHKCQVSGNDSTQMSGQWERPRTNVRSVGSDEKIFAPTTRIEVMPAYKNRNKNVFNNVNVHVDKWNT